VGQGAGLDAVAKGKKKIPVGNRTPAVQPVACLPYLLTELCRFYRDAILDSDLVCMFSKL
jgi:hypothetical protein